MMPRRILVAGIGNIFLGDDAFGVEVVRRLARRPLPEGVRAEDFGIRGIDLAYALSECETAILVDAAPRGGEPGTLYVIEPQAPADGGGSAADLPDAHGLTPEAVLRLVTVLGGATPRVLLVGCEPRPLDAEEDACMDLSPPVRAAVEEAVPLVESLVGRVLAESAQSTERSLRT